MLQFNKTKLLKINHLYKWTFAPVAGVGHFVLGGGNSFFFAVGTGGRIIKLLRHGGRNNGA